jgi:hypothetical protein
MHTHLLVRFGSGCEVRSEGKMEVIFYHLKHLKECDHPSYGDNFRGISRMLATAKIQA